VSDDLTVLRADFPAYRIWREETPGRIRYVARSRHPGLNPFTVVTPDLGELRDALQSAPQAQAPEPPEFSPGQPNIARMYSYWLNGKDHYGSDRAAAEMVLEKFPEVAEVARANRAFLARAVRYVVSHGVSQFIDAGSGLPASPNVHETARAVNTGSRVVYVDRDLVVLAHARALLAPDDQVGVVAGDIRGPRSFLTGPALTEVIDATAPVCVLLGSVLHFLAPAEADAAVAAFREWMAPGSYLVISAGTSTGVDPELIQRLRDAYAGTAPVTGRTASEIEAWFEGFTLVPPGLVDVHAWRPNLVAQPAPSRARILAGAGRKNATAPTRPA